jgi:hypothetical protein
MSSVASSGSSAPRMLSRLLVLARRCAGKGLRDVRGGLGDRSALPHDLTALAERMDKVVANVRQHAGFDGLVGCVA